MLKARHFIRLAGCAAEQGCQYQQLGLSTSRLAIDQLCSSSHFAALQFRRAYGETLEESNKKLLRDRLPVNPLELTKTFEDAGLPRDAAERFAERIATLIVLNTIKLEETFVKQAVFEKTVLEQSSNFKVTVVEQANNIQGFKNELQKTQDMHQANMNKDMERQQSYLDKMKAEVRHEIDKLSSSQRLDLNLEKGRMRDDFQAMRDKITELQLKVDRDTNELKSSVEKAKNDTIKSVITILGTFSAIAFTISRFVQMGAGG